ncbi:hypothetical protein HJC23_011236 [Cyclotella cryptica]|uniref:DUF1995 domain-containing protein n=1 Tax=Cyclotella cryptica TaxID=29204 RepID=A0ABD3QVN2_9STRA|eukprot:CCRYP_001622-RB/>CCRYP_001622-RB protein AED:0.00 eAED:0.00 QI:140/-1/1/1/-1/1/1/69/409
MPKLTSRFVHLSCALVASAFRYAIAFTAPREYSVRLPSFRYTPHLSSSSNDDWGMEPDPRMEAMRSMLEKSWNGNSMGKVPARPENAAEAAADSVASAMAKQHNILMIDLRLPSYDITEGPKLYDKKAVYDFCTCLSDQLRERKLIRRSLVLVRNEQERRDTERASKLSKEEITIDDEDDSWDSSEVSEANEVEEFRKKLLDSWDTPTDKSSPSITAEPSAAPKPTVDPNSSHRLWSMIGNEEITSGSDMFDQVVAAVDKHARLVVTGPSSEQEDALIIVSPYDTTDLIAVRRILARYGQTRTIIIVNSRLESLPVELNSAVLVYAVMPLVARSTSRTNAMEEEDDSEAGLKVVVMKRFPEHWGLFVDVYGDGFLPAGANGPDQPSTDSKDFPSTEWIVRSVQAYMEGL